MRLPLGLSWCFISVGVEILMARSDADSILKQVVIRYKTFNSYQDEGSVETVPFPGQRPLEFKTVFSKPDRFCFQWRTWHPHVGAGNDPLEAKVWFDGTTCRSLHLEEEKEDSVSLCLAEGLGVSSGSIIMILKLLLPLSLEMNKFWTEMKNARIQNEDIVDGVHCYHLVGDCESEEDTEAWIGKDSFVVHRLRAHMHISLEAVEETRRKALELFKSLGMAETSPAVIEALSALPAQARSYYHQYNYRKVVIDGPVEI